MIRKALAAVISAAIVVSACLVPAFRSTAATLTPVNSDAGMDADGNLQNGGITMGTAPDQLSTDMWKISLPATFDSIVADKLAKTITFKNFIADGELYPQFGSNGYTYIFEGTSSIDCIAIDDSTTKIYLSVTPGSILTTKNWHDGVNPYILLASGTTADPSNLPDKSPIKFTGAEDNANNFELTPEMIDEILKRINEIIYEEDLLDFEKALNNAALNATTANPQVLYFNHGEALPRDVMRTLSSNPNLNVVFHYRYGDKVYQLWINGAQAARFFNEDTKWYGPEWLAAHFPADTSGLFEFEK